MLFHKKHQPNFEINKTISPEKIIFLKSSNKEQVIDELIQVLHDENNNDYFTEIKNELLKRENLMSTGIGAQVAIPHVRNKLIEKLQVAVGIHKNGINWHSFDKIDVKIIILILVPDISREEYLMLLSGITKILRNQDHRDKIIAMNKADEVYKIFTCDM